MWSVCHHMARVLLPEDAGIHETGECSAHALHGVMLGFLWCHFSQERRNQAPLRRHEQVGLGSALPCGWRMQHTYQRQGRKKDCILGSVILRSPLHALLAFLL